MIDREKRLGTFRTTRPVLKLMIFDCKWLLDPLIWVVLRETCFLAYIAARRDVYLHFKALNMSQSGFLSLDEFYALYDIANLKWKVVVMFVS